MQKKFVTNLALLLFLNLLIKPFWILGIDRAVQNEVGAEDYGIYFALFNFSFLMNIILDFGITNFNNKNIAQNNHLLTKHLSSLVALKLLLALIYIVVTLGFGLAVGYDFRLMKLLMVLGLNQFLISFVLYLRSNLAGLHLFKTDSIISVLDRSIMIIICAMLLWGNILDKPLDIMMYVYAQTFSYGLTAVITFIIVLAKTEQFRVKFSFPFFLMILKKSFPFAVLVLLMTFYNRIDTVMLERMLPDGALQSGIYAQAYRILDATNMIAFLFAGLLLPMFSRMLKYKEPVEQLVKLSFTILIVPAIVIATGCFFYSYELMEMLYVDHIEEASHVFRLLMICFVAISTTYIFGTLLTANGNMKELNLMAASGMLINIGLNLFLIPTFSAKGSAVSSLITQSITALAQVLIVQHKFRFKKNYSLLLKMLLFIAGVAAFNIFCKQIPYDANKQLGWMPGFVLMIAISFAWAFIIRIIRIKSVMRILKYG